MKAEKKSCGSRKEIISQESVGKMPVSLYNNSLSLHSQGTFIPFHENGDP